MPLVLDLAPPVKKPHCGGGDDGRNKEESLAAATKAIEALIF